MKYVAMVPGNVSYCVALAKELHTLGTFGRQGPEFDWDWCVKQCHRILSSRNYYGRFAVDDSGTYVGGLMGHLDSFMFSPKLMALEDAFYVRAGTPKRAQVGAMLMKGFCEWAFGNGAVLVQTGDIAAIDSHAVYRFYMQMGFEKFGVVYQKRLK